MNAIKLIKPSLDYSNEIMAFRQELLDTGSEFSGCGSLQNCTTANQWINLVEKNEAHIQEGRVTSHFVFIVALSC